MTLADELRRALRARRMTGKALGETIGMSHSTVYDILRHGRVPTVQTAMLMADALDWVPLVTVAISTRTKACEVCGATFVDGGRNCTARCCSAACQRTRYKRSLSAATQATFHGRARVAENRLALHQSAVAAFCRACTAGESLCTQPRCELRSVSPIPLARWKAA